MTKKIILVLLCISSILFTGCSNSKQVDKAAIAETVIVGDTPVTYYDIEGIENLNKKDTLNITN